MTAHLRDGSSLYFQAPSEVAYPHVCAGERCAICRWVVYRMTKDWFRFWSDFSMKNAAKDVDIYDGRRKIAGESVSVGSGSDSPSPRPR